MSREPIELDEYDIGRGTARKAIALFRERGLVETEPHRGTFVVKKAE